MKKSLYVLSVLLTITLMFSMLYSCGTPISNQASRAEMEHQEALRRQREQARLRRTYRGILETSAFQMVKALIEKISPMSGKDPKVIVDLEEIYFDEKENLVAADVLLTWQARDFWTGVPYDECQVKGTLYVYMPIRSMDVTTAILQDVIYNEQLRLVSTKQNLTDLNAGIRITVR